MMDGEQHYNSATEDGAAGHFPATILAVDDDPQALEILLTSLGEAGFEVLTAMSGEEALGTLAKTTPDLILLDLMMPGMNGHDLLRELKGRKETSDIPVVVITALDQVEEKEKAIEGGADDFLSKPIARSELLIRIRTFIRVKHLRQELERTLLYLHELETTRHSETATQESGRVDPTRAPLASILIVEDELMERAIYADLLREQGYKVLTAPTAAQALELLQMKPVDVVLVDLVLPGLSGLELIERLRSIIPETPVVVVTAHPSSHNVIAALKLGAFDFIVKGFKPEVMLHSVKRALERRRLELQHQALVADLKSKVDRILQRQA
ncbi:MAG: response regulator [Candidatus Methylomirabilales bacterium]